MTPDELLGVTPALLAKSILHRRERLAEVIPEQLDARQEELVAAEPLARAAKEKRDGINANGPVNCATNSKHLAASRIQIQSGQKKSSMKN